jgi:U32 family peptidase
VSRSRSVELLAPAGSEEKLRHVYLYGADAAYMGIEGLSLRARAESAAVELAAGTLAEIKGSKRLYGAVNAYVHEDALPRFEATIEALGSHPFDAFIVSDLGLVPTLRRYHPGTELHLSTQANCVNSEAVKMYRDLGFTRVVPGRELSLREIERIKSRVPDVELEVFVHGAMCLAYSGRCFLSAWMADRSGNRGDCAHSCRWDYRLRSEGLSLEEKKRPGELYPVYEGDGYTSILSSKDINMVDHVGELIDAGVDSLKIEGRMKSTYYAAVVTRAYRKALDQELAQRGAKPTPGDIAPFVAELYGVSHRDFTTGFYFGRDEVEKPAAGSYRRSHRFLAIVGPQQPGGGYALTVKNSITVGTAIEFLGPDTAVLRDASFRLADAEGNPVHAAHHSGQYIIHPSRNIDAGFLIRSTGEEEDW